MKPQCSHHLVSLLSLAALAFAGIAPAQTELSKPYDLHIVVHVAPNRLLTNVFRDRIERELHDGVQAALGEMGTVTVLDLDQELSKAKNKKKTPALQRLEDVRAQGLQQLKEWKDRSDVKTHFIFIDYADGHYEIQARQYDGVTGRASPVIRRDRTRDRDFVAKAVFLLLKQDFGVLGTVLTEATGPRGLVKVELRGGELGSMARWVKQGDVFALAPPGGGSPLALKWAYLVVEDAPGEDARDGACMCRFYHRYRVPSITGYRCIKLGTVTAPLRLRWMQEVPGRNVPPKPLANFSLTVDIRRNGFEGEDATRLQKNFDNGILETVADGEKGVFKNIAFIRVTSGLPDPMPQVPVALVDDQPIYVEVNNARGGNTLFTFRKASWQRSVADSRLVQDNLFRRLELLGSKVEEREQLIQEAERGLKRCQDERADLLKQKAELVQEARDSGSQMTTTIEDRYLKDLEKGEAVLAEFIDKQKGIEEKENDPQVKKWRSDIERAKLLEKDLEFGKAIAIYERIKKDGYQNADLEKHLAKLHKLWDPADDDHRSQRSYIYNVWPTLDSSQLEENIPKARQALQKCDKVKDYISIRKLLKGTEVHADRLAKELSELHPDIVAPDEKEAAKLKKISEELLKLGKEIQQALAKAQGDE